MSIHLATKSGHLVRTKTAPYHLATGCGGSCGCSFTVTQATLTYSGVGTGCAGFSLGTYVVPTTGPCVGQVAIPGQPSYFNYFDFTSGFTVEVASFATCGFVPCCLLFRGTLGVPISDCTKPIVITNTQPAGGTVTVTLA